MTSKPLVALHVVAATGLIALAVWTSVGVVDRSGDPHAYYEYRNLDVLPAYPTTQVIECVAVIAVVLIASLAILWLGRKTSLAVRLVAIFALFLLVTMCGLPFAMMHAPPYSGGFLAFSFLGGGWALGMAIVTGLTGLVVRRRG